MSVADFQELIDYFDYRLRTACLAVTSLEPSDQRAWMKKKLVGEIHVALSQVSAAYGRGFTPSVPPFLSALSRELQPPDTVSFDVDSITRAMERTNVTQATCQGGGLALDWWTSLNNERAPKRPRQMTDHVPELLAEYRRHRASATLASKDEVVPGNELFSESDDEDVVAHDRPQNELFSESDEEDVIASELVCEESMEYTEGGDVAANDLFDDMDTDGLVAPPVVFPEDMDPLSCPSRAHHSQSAMITASPEPGTASDERDASAKANTELTDLAPATGDGEAPPESSRDRELDRKRGQALVGATDANRAPTKRARREGDDTDTASPNPGNENTAPGTALSTRDTNAGATSNNVLRRQPSDRGAFRVRIQLTQEQHDMILDLQQQVGRLRDEVDVLEIEVVTLQNRVGDLDYQAASTRERVDDLEDGVPRFSSPSHGSSPA
ncbi:hypothetical protein FPV67DRAFT_1675802 [Lyophyllum atratum]|nr:hypothetical protein FPV67DRAFT_1675802 [Lyophyllum atratum]